MGARVRLRIGSQWQLREVRRGDSYLGSHDPRLHFGLGKAAQVDEIQIRWPNGATSVLREVPANQFLTLHEPHSKSRTSLSARATCCEMTEATKRTSYWSRQSE
ncbi:MAG: ASPIC/UnbV domain-containing protein [Acidobacteria bacterium]|nr:ASPIC/UnbV domain-containing protein [Acidobacteriota bacterium]